jgi:hypothetical protein
MRPLCSAWFPCVGLVSALLVGSTGTVARAGLLVEADSQAPWARPAEWGRTGIDEGWASERDLMDGPAEDGNGGDTDAPGSRTIGRVQELPVPLHAHLARSGSGGMGTARPGPAPDGFGNAALLLGSALRLQPALVRWLRSERSLSDLTRERLKVFRPPRDLFAGNRNID